MKRVLTVIAMLLVVTGVFAGDWYPYAQEDKITDITSLALIYVDEEQPNAMFSVLFSNGLTRFAIITNEYFSDRDNKITYRFDKEEPVTIKGWIGTGDVTVVFDSKTFLDDLKEYSQLIIRLKPYKEPYMDIIIDLTNFNKVYKMSEPVIELILGE